MTTWPLLHALVHPLISHTGNNHCGPSTVPQWRLGLILPAPLKAMVSAFLKLLPKGPHCCTADVWASLSFPGSGSPFLSPQPCSLRSGDRGFSSLSASSAIWVLGPSCKPSIPTELLSAPRHFLLAHLSGDPYLSIPYFSLPPPDPHWYPFSHIETWCPLLSLPTHSLTHALCSLPLSIQSP